MRQIIGFALISATIGIVAQLSRSSAKKDPDNEIAGFLDMMVGGLLQGVWSMVVFFAIPVYVVESRGAIASIRRSWDIFKQTWGENFTGKAAIGGVGCLVKLMLLSIIVALIAVTVATKSMTLLGLTILLGIMSFTVLALLGRCGSIYRKRPGSQRLPSMMICCFANINPTFRKILE